MINILRDSIIENIASIIAIISAVLALVFFISPSIRDSALKFFREHQTARKLALILLLVLIVLVTYLVLPILRETELQIVAETDPGIFLIEGRGYDNYNIDDKLIVYQERIQGIEEAVALLRVIKINPSSLSARAELISPVTSLRTKDRVDSKLENLIGTRLYPTANPNDHGIIGYFIQGQQSNGTILIFPSVNIEPGNILIEMAPVIQEEGIIVAYQPRQNSSQLRVVNANAQSATVLLERGFLPEPGTLLALQTNTTLPGTYEKPDLGFQYPDNWVLRETPHGDCSDCLEVRIATSEDYFGSINGPGGLAAIYLEPSYIIEDKDIQSLLRDTLIPAFLSKIPLIVHTSVPITIVEDKRDGQLHKTTGEFEFDIDSVSFFGRGTIIHDLAESKVVVIISYFTKDFIEEFDAGYRLILESLDF